MKLLLFIVTLGISVSFAQTKTLSKEPPVPYETTPVDPETAATMPSSPPPVQEPRTITPEPEALPTKVLRGLTRYTANLHYSFLSTWIPSKFGASLGYHYDERWTFEGEYTSASLGASFQSVDFGEIVDRRYGLQARWYPGTNSFHWIMGIYRSEFTAEIGNTIINNIGTVPEQTIFKIQSTGPLFGVANRWQWKQGVSVGVDWFVIYWPLFDKTVDDEVLKYITNSSDRSDVDKVTGVVSRIPQFDLFKLHLGYSF